jgi:threonine/homoserine/homoserine lactone efflux protein
LGVGAVVQRSEVVFQAMKLGGAGYLVYLGIRAWRGRRSLVIAVPGGPRHDGWRGVREGFVVGVANPKAVIFFTAVLPQFVDQRAGHVTLQLIVLGGLFVLLAFVTDSLWGLAASQVRAWFARSPRRLAAVGGAGGLAMIALGVSLAVTGRRE